MSKTSVGLAFLIIAFSANVEAQQRSIGLSTGIGVNILDVEESEGYALEEWDVFSSETVIDLLFENDGLVYGGEVGAHRLYYWERRSTTTGYFIWGTLWTYYIGGVIGTRVNENLVLTTGMNIRSYSDGSGSTPGLLFSGAYSIKLSDDLSIPVGIRTDLIFGTATTFSVNLSGGLRYQL